MTRQSKALAKINVVYELDKFEHFVFNRDYKSAYGQFVRILNATSVHSAKPERVFTGLSVSQREYLATRFAAVSFQMLMDPTFNLNDEGYETLSLLSRHFATILLLTPYRNADHIIRHLVGQTEVASPRDSMSLFDFKKMLFLWSIYSDVELPFERFCQNHPDLMRYVVINSLSFSCYVDPEVSRRRDLLLELLAKGDFAFRFNDQLLPYGGSLWMHITYAENLRKHYAKDTINRAYRQWMLQQGVTEPPLPVVRKIQDKPRLVVVVEQMHKTHSVFRCYGKALRSMSKRFHTVGMGFKDYVDDVAMSIFDEAVYFDSNIVGDMRRNVGKIIKQKPDVILYVSLGMQNSTIPMANMRLAPIQMLFPAHPATSRIPTIDYLFTEKGAEPHGRDDLSEKLILLDGGAFAYTDEAGFKHVNIKETYVNKAGKRIVRVAVPSYVMKVGSQVIDALKTIEDNAQHDIEFHFFPHLNENPYIIFKQRLESRLKNVVVHLPYTYGKYLEKLGSCDLYLSTFPFSNYNGTMDSIKVNLPVLALDCGGLEDTGEMLLLRRLGFPEWVTAKTREDYINTAVELIDNEAKRNELAEYSRELDVGSIFDGFNDVAETTGDAIYSVYLAHEQIQSSEQRWFTIDEVNQLLESDAPQAANNE